MSLFKDMFNDSFHSLSEKEIVIFNFISLNIHSVCEMNIKELSLKLDISEYSINKFCKKINVDNFENLKSILKELNATSINSSNLIFKDSLNGFSNFINKIDEINLINICNLILKDKNVSILFSDSSKIIAKYLDEGLKNLNIKTKLTSSPKQILKQKDCEIVIYISSLTNERTLNSTLEQLSNKSIITICDLVSRKAYDNSSMFVHIETNKLFKNFNTNSNCLYFVFFDLMFSKLIELTYNNF